MWEVWSEKEWWMVYTYSRGEVKKWRCCGMQWYYVIRRLRPEGQTLLLWKGRKEVISMSVNIRITEREKTKVVKYQKLKEEIRMWNIRSSKFVPLTVGALEKNTEKIENLHQ